MAPLAQGLLVKPSFQPLLPCHFWPAVHISSICQIVSRMSYSSAFLENSYSLKIQIKLLLCCEAFMFLLVRVHLFLWSSPVLLYWNVWHTMLPLLSLACLPTRQLLESREYMTINSESTVPHRTSHRANNQGPFKECNDINQQKWMIPSLLSNQGWPMRKWTLSLNIVKDMLRHGPNFSHNVHTLRLRLHSNLKMS